jgi:Kef-type K+ transport system membrane component KefB
MISRGEVGLIFASAGKALGVIDDSIFGAIVAMVMLTNAGHSASPQMEHPAKRTLAPSPRTEKQPA